MAPVTPQPRTRPPPGRRARKAPPHVGLLMVLLLLCARTFQYFPVLSLVQELAFVGAPLVLAFIAWRGRRAVGWTPGFEVFAVLLMLVMPVWSGLAAMDAFGQPAVFGVLAWRGYGLIAVGLGLLYALRLRWISLRAIDQAFVACAWFTLALYVLMSLLLDAANFTDYGIGLVEERMDEGTRFKFNPTFLLYAIAHYSTRAYRTHRPVLYLPALMFFAFLFGSAGGRILTVCLVLTALFMMARLGGTRHMLVGAGKLAAGLAILVAAAFAVAPQATAERIGKFGDAFSAFGGDADLIDDASAASRVLQTLIALPAIEEHPLAGNGRISAQWVEEGFKGYYGAHFFPDDIGLIGMVYQYGLLGVAVFMGQFVWAFRAVAKLHPGQSPIEAESFLAFLVFLAISSLPTGNFVMFPELTLLLTALLLHAARPDRPRPTPRSTRVRRAAGRPSGLAGPRIRPAPGLAADTGTPPAR